MKYIAMKHDPSLVGTTAEELATADMVSRVHDDLYDKLGLAFKANDMDLLIAKVKEVSQIYSTFLGGKKFMVGDTLTFVDFSILELIEKMDYYTGNICTDNFDNLKAFRDRMHELPRFSEVIKGDYWVRK